MFDVGGIGENLSLLAFEVAAVRLSKLLAESWIEHIEVRDSETNDV